MGEDETDLTRDGPILLNLDDNGSAPSNGSALALAPRFHPPHDLQKLLDGTCWLFDARDFPGAAVFAFGEPSDEEFNIIASICGRYSKGLKEDSLAIIAKKGTVTREFNVKPADHKDIEPLLIK